MRELTVAETEEVAGGFDGMKLPGGNYISGTRTIMGGLGLTGALTVAFDIGWNIGSAIDSRMGYSSRIGGAAYNKWGQEEAGTS